MVKSLLKNPLVIAVLLLFFVIMGVSMSHGAEPAPAPAPQQQNITAGQAMGVLLDSAITGSAKVVEAAKPSLNTTLAYMLDKVRAGVDWSIEQAPSVVQEFLAYKRWTLTLGIIVLGLGTLCSLSALGYACFARNGNENQGIPGIFGCVLFGIPFLIIMPDVIKIWVAPKVYLLEYAVHLLK